jgi:short-subunit dehydrogenase
MASVAFVTGASRGIGAAIGVELCKEGYHVCLVARDAAQLKAVAQDCKKVSGFWCGIDSVSCAHTSTRRGRMHG